MKQKIRSVWDKVWSFLRQHKTAALILAPCLAVLLAAVLVVPRSSMLAYRLRGPAPTPESLYVQTEPPVMTGMKIAPVPSAVPPAPMASPSPSAQPAPEAVRTSLRASSTERDLYITVYNEDGQPVTGETFTLAVGYPDGQTYHFDTETDGSCYLVQLEGGDYSVGMLAHEGYVPAETITCSVKATLTYERIEDVDKYLDIKDVTEVPQDEVDVQDEYIAPNETVAEVIVSPQEEAAPEPVPVLDANGHQTYTYTYDVGENGFLLYRESLEESNVIPVDEDNDGQLDFGMYFFVPQTPEEGSESGLTSEGYYVSEILFNEDNTPVDTYAIYAEPIMREGSANLAGWRTIDGSIYYYDENGEPVHGLKKIDGKIYYFDQYGVRASSVGIDVSYYDGDINWQAVKAQGIDFAIIRVGGRTWQNGTIYYDSRTIEYFTEAKRAGLKVGAYFYSTAVTELEAVQEASVALEVLNGVGLDYPVFFDTEQSGIYPEGRADNLDRAQRSAIIRAFCETITNSSSYSAGVYSGEYFMKNSLDYNSFSKYTVWLASYTSNNSLPNFGKRYDIWQFTDRGVIDGINGYVDMNVIF